MYFVKFRIKNTFATTRNHSNQFKSMNPHYDPLETIIRPFFFTSKRFATDIRNAKVPNEKERASKNLLPRRVPRLRVIKY